jgi:hypothetical protein
MAQASIFQVKQIGNIPWILPNNISVGQSLSFLISNVAGTHSPLTGIGTGDFQLKWSGSDAQVTTASSLNLFDPDKRKEVRDSLDQFITALDTLEQTNDLVPGGARLVTQITSQYLPLPLTEIPLYAFNMVNPLLYPFLDTTQTYMDLLPGMRLNVYYGNFYQEPVGQKTTPGYGGTGNGYLYVNTIPGTNQLSYETFLDQMGVNVAQGGNSKIRVAAAAVDFMSSQELQPYNRLFYPTPPGTMFTSVNVPDGDPSKNTTVVRADTYLNMLGYTNSFPYCCQAAEGRCTLLFGRSQIIPEINVRVNGDNTYIPAGTTLRHIIERSCAAVTRPKSLQFQRYVNQSPVNINFENATIGYDMFLVQGDDLSW